MSVAAQVEGARCFTYLIATGAWSEVLVGEIELFNAERTRGLVRVIVHRIWEKKNLPGLLVVVDDGVLRSIHDWRGV